MARFLEEHRIKNKIKGVFDSVMDKKEDENMYTITEVFVKHYGFDVIIYIPPTLSLIDFRKYIPSLSSAYGGQIVAEYSKDKRSVYMRCHLQGLEIRDLDNIKFKWYGMMTGDSYRSKIGETFVIAKSVPIKNINKTEDNIVGYRLFVDIPNGLSYDNLIKLEDNISKQIGKCIIKWEDKCFVEIILNQLSDDEKFVPIKLKSPYQLYLAMNYCYKPIVVDLSKSPHLLYTGITQSGKTVTVITGITNMCYQFDVKEVQLFCSMISDKQDLRIFKDVENCMYYANTVRTTVRVLKYLHNEMKRRNAIFESSNKFCSSMYEYNRQHPNDKMPIVIASFDEMTLYQPLTSESKEIKAIKQTCIDLMRTLIIESASAGINMLICLQRPDKESLNPNIKSQLNSKICFFQNTTASSLVAIDSDRCTKLKRKREAIVEYNEGTELVKTLYITNEMVLDLLKDKISKDHKHLDLDIEGNIVIEKPLEIAEITPKTDEKPLKSSEKVIFITKKPKSRWQESQERKAK